MTDDRYPSVRRDPRELRPRRANRIAALAIVGFLVLVVVLLALFA